MIHEFCDELNQYLKKRYNLDSNPANVQYSNSINVYDDLFNMYLRYKPQVKYGSDTLVIASIVFSKRGKGNGKDFLNFLINLSVKYNFDKIAIEHTDTDDGKRFAQRYGFQNSFDENNWIITISDLKKNLAIV